ncbi:MULTISPECIES: TetR/AcrR family transcriptional regulator [Streptomyces]|uniref:DNA-binding transcriptional regulator EnvR n=1 Tax=Streptomyces rubrolavendulae TaxID=285473 RepID=A0A1D8G975_9ACTN|nr:MULTISPECIES: TetR/AcrR family transcriptional regulator [Streptomyces]AOT62009.1 DNA-binding transcriptional regulator EnvR [Streptomyces rubrolavendulae]UQS29715.1 TetR/AcrR family transcriptional regulator [Streptomyces fradiae]
MTSPPPPGRTELPLTPVEAPTQLRADAARNRARLLEAAARLAAEHGAANLTMEAVACAAQVGKGTVFRRFGDRSGLLLALLDREEERFQAAFMTGPAPLGPGAPAAERLHAFGPAVLRHEDAHRDLYLAAAQPDPVRRHTVPARRVRLAHLAALLREAGTDADPELAAQTLLGYLDPGLVRYLLSGRGLPLSRVEAGWHDLVARMLPAEAR